ncbi:MAG: hypothetical protein KBT01_01455 [Clostridiales bacterium]|nr:hypothetical protein [Candidatus Blautia equi]
MSAFILCQTRKAGRPYYIENIRTNIYTIEELCYYLCNNLYLVDSTIMNEELCTWLGEELGLQALAYKMRGLVGKYTAEADMLYPIFREINYLTYEEMKDLNARLTKLEKETPLVREKKKVDTLMKNEMYVQAIRGYQMLLGKPEMEEEGEFKAAIMNNLGCAFARLFQMDRAADCFRKAFETCGNKEYLKSFLLAYRSVRTPIEYASVQAELGVDAKVISEVSEELEHFARKPEPQVYIQHVDEILERLTSEYHRSTGA